MFNSPQILRFHFQCLRMTCTGVFFRLQYQIAINIVKLSVIKFLVLLLFAVLLI